MKILIVEDDWASRKFMQKFLTQYGECDVVVDGLEALEAVLLSLQSEEFYDLVCLDIMIPKVDGVKVLKTLRELEKKKGILPERRAKVIMTTALTGSDFIKEALKIGCEGYVEKPIDIQKVIDMMRKLELIPD